MKILVVSYKKPSENILNQLFLNILSKKIKITFVTYESRVSTKYKTRTIKKKNSNISFFSVKNLSTLDTIIKKKKPQIILNYFIENLTYEFEKLYIHLKQKNIPSLKIIEHPFQWYRPFRKLKNKISKKKYIYDHAILCSKISEYSHKHHSFKKKYFFCNINYVQFKNDKEKIYKNKKLNVFLDENFVDHPDVKIHNLTNFPTSEKYHNQLIVFFDFIKKEFKKKVCIAAHPTTLKNKFNQYKITYDNTLKLVKKANLIMLHHSSAIDYAILSKKDLLFLTSNEINKLQDAIVINKLSKFFNTRPLNLSMKYDYKIIEKRIVRYKDNVNVYNNFVKEFIKHPKFSNSTKLEKIYNDIISYKES